MSISVNQYLAMLARTQPCRSSVLKASDSAERESKLHEEILSHCRNKGWLAVHSRTDKPTTQAVGVSDFIIATPHAVMFIECKRPGRKPTPAQLAFLAHARRLGWPATAVYSFEEYLEFVLTKASHEPTHAT